MELMCYINKFIMCFYCPKLVKLFHLKWTVHSLNNLSVLLFEII